MNRIDRLTGILLRLQSQRYVSVKELEETYHVSERTVFRDISSLLEAGVPLYNEPSLGYTLVDGYKLPPIMFSKDEIAALILSSKYTEHITDRSLKTDLDNALIRLRSVLPEETKDYVERLEKRTTTLPNLRKNEINDNVIKTIQNAIGEKRTLELNYYSHYRKEWSTRNVYPLNLVHYLYQWHLFAYCTMRNDIRDFRLDRIKEVTVKETFSGHDDFDLQHYLDQREEYTPESIVTIKAPNNLIPRMKDYFLSGRFDVLKKEATYSHIQFNSYSDTFTAKWLLSFGDQIQIISPVEFKQTMLDTLQHIINHHSTT